MSPCNSTARVSALLSLVLVFSLSAGCATPNEIRRPCCYEGELTLAPLEQVRFVMNDGSELPFDQVYKGFASDESDFPKKFPIQRIGISGLVYDVLSVVFPEYDANKNGIVEEPEFTVLYLREGALGMGFEVSHLAVEQRVLALQTSPADVGGLVKYIDANKTGMSKDARALWFEIAYLTDQIQRRGVGAADQTFLGP